MKHPIKNRTQAIALCMLAMVVAFSVYTPFQVSAQQAEAKGKRKQDNTPRKSVAPNKSNATYEEVKLEMQRAMQEVEQAMQRLSKEELPRMRAEIQKALQEVNGAQMQREMERAVKEINMPAIQQEMQAALKAIQNEQVAAEVSKAMKEINFEKMQIELKQLEQINMAGLQQGLKKVQEELERTNLNLEGVMENAHKHIEVARQQMKLVTDGIDELEKDGLIKKTDTINIDWEKETLILNGVRQSNTISDKYRKYFGSGHFKFKNDSKRGSL